MFGVKESYDENKNQKLNELFAARFKKNSGVCTNQTNIEFDHDLIDAIKKEYIQKINDNDEYKKTEIAVIETTLQQLDRQKNSSEDVWKAVPIILSLLTLHISTLNSNSCNKLNSMLSKISKDPYKIAKVLDDYFKNLNDKFSNIIMQMCFIVIIAILILNCYETFKRNKKDKLIKFNTLCLNALKLIN